MTVLSPDALTYGEDPDTDPGPEWPSLLADLVGPARNGEAVVKWPRRDRRHGPRRSSVGRHTRKASAPGVSRNPGSCLRRQPISCRQPTCSASCTMRFATTRSASMTSARRFPRRFNCSTSARPSRNTAVHFRTSGLPVQKSDELEPALQRP
jgi:hypothetical protein